MPTPSPAEDIATVPAPFRVTARRQETADTWTLELEGRHGGFAPGQFTMLSRGGAGEVPISISGDPADRTRIVQTVRAVGLATAAICDAQPGDVLGVRGPFGRPWPVDALHGADVVVAAGGIGLAPLRPVVLALLAARERFGRIWLLYGGRDPDQLLYTDELDAWREAGVEVLVTVDTAPAGWTGRVGVVTRLVDRIDLAPDTTAAVICGPEIMMRFTAQALVARGVAPARVFVSAERTMQCGVGECGHCQLGPTLVCRDGPVYAWDALSPWLAVREL